VNDKKILLFPSALGLARRRAKLSQKALALASGMDQSYVCGVEKGRRATPKAEAIERLAASLRETAGSGSLEDFRWAAAHDRVLHAVATQDLPDAAQLVAAALRASRCLAPEERAGLLSYINRAIESRLHLGQLSKGGRASTTEEVPM
jgi:transcriptional regulator with XRE-family HTH domain